MPHISIKAEEIAQLFGVTITNSILTTWLVMLLLVVLALIVSKNISLIPKNKFTNFIESIVEGLYDLFQGITGENTPKFFPLLGTIFIFVITANWIGLLPGVGSIGIVKKSFAEATHPEEKFIPLFRGPTADLNTTLALAFISVVAIQYYGMRTLGLKVHMSKYINFKNPINFFVGLLETISEISRIISFSFRLFGNIFAGEVLLTVVAFLTPLIIPFVPLPFFALEVFVGFIQALVFSMLTAVFLSVATARESH